MSIKYKILVSYSLLVAMAMVLISSPVQASSWGNYNQPECHRHDASTASHSRWRSFFHFKRHWLGSQHCSLINNVKPVAKAGPNHTIHSAETIILDGTKSIDSDGTIVSYRWKLMNRFSWPFHAQSQGKLVNNESAEASFTAPSSRYTRYFIFRLRVTDNDGATSTDYVRVKVRRASAKPKVTIEGGGNFESNETVELTAKLRRLRPNATYSWSQLSGPLALFASADDQKTVSIKLPEVSDTETLVFQVGVKYAHRRTMHALKTITVNKPLIPVSHISGRILNVAGTGIANATITALDKTELTPSVISQSDSNGEFSLSLQAETQYVLQLSASNFSSQVIPVVSPSVNNAFSLNNVVMAKRGQIHSITDNGEQTIEATDGASVTFDKANFVDANGQPLTGDLQLTITPIDVSNTRSIEAFPGLFLGESQTSISPELIVSLGAVEFHFTHNGEPVSLASGATANVLIPIYVNNYPDGQFIEAGDTTPLRSLNEKTGIWSQEGSGTVVRSTASPTGLAYQAAVTHFSWWGSDVAVATPPGDTTPNTGVANAIVTVNGPAGLGLAVIDATAPGLVNWRGSTVSIALDVGDSTPSLIIPANRSVCFSAYFFYISGLQGDSNTVCVNAASQATVNVDLDVGQTGPVDVVVMPQLSDDTAFIQGFKDVQSPALRIAPTTIETTVSYVLLSGSLPAGLSLDILDNVLNLIGTPTTVGEETFVIRATDADTNTDDITVTYNVSSVNPPPIIVEDTSRFFAGEITMIGGTDQVNLNDLTTNIGGPITMWREVTGTVDQAECSSMYAAAGIKGRSADYLLPASVDLDHATGELTFNSPEFWLGCLRANNPRGESIFIFGFEIMDAIP